MKKILSYSAKRRLKKIFGISAAVIAAIFLLIVLRFVYLQRYIVYDESGVHLEYRNQVSSNKDAAQEQPSGQFILEQESAVGEQIDTPTEGQIPVFSGIYLTAAQLLDANVRAALPEKLENANALMVDVKTSTGQFLYASSLTGIDRTETDLTAFLAELSKLPGVTLIARLPAFRDSSHAQVDFSQALPIEGGALWMDTYGSYWLDPAGKDVPAYLADQAKELYAMGFDEIVFDDFNFPSSINIVYPADRNGTEAAIGAAQAVVNTLAESSIPVSFVSHTPEIISLSARAFILAETGDMVSQTAREYSLLLPGSDARLVFLTASRDTRFESYSVLSPFTLEET